MGNCGRDPEVRYLPSGQAVANVSIATSTRRKNRETGDMVEDTQWHRITFYDRLAEIAGEYVRKGSKLYIEGSLRTRKWQDPQGQDRYTTEIIAADIQMLDSKGGSSAGGYPDAPAAERSAPAAAAQQKSRPQAAPQAVAQDAFDELDDDIPF